MRKSQQLICILFHVFGSFACALNVCVPYACQVPMESRGRHPIPWITDCLELFYGCWESHPSSIQEQQVF